MRLRVHDADPARVERIRARCIALLAAQQRREAALRSRGPAWRAWLEPALAVVAGVLYLAEAVAQAIAAASR